MAFGTIKALLFAAVASAAFSAQQSHAQRMTTMLPGTVKNFELPNFDENTGAKQWDLFGNSATYKSDTRIDVEGLKLMLFEEKDGKLKATITSPEANVNPVKKFVSGDTDIFVVAPEFKIGGKKWTWDSAKKFVEVFNGIKVNITPSGDGAKPIGKEGAAAKDYATLITGEYGSMLNGSESNVFEVRKGVELVNSQMKLECDRLRANAPKEKKSETGLDEIFASGNVKMLYENKDIRAGEARIDPGASTAFLSGSPHIKDIPSSAEISGSSIALDKNKKTLAAESAGGIRATAVIFNTGDDGEREKITISADSIKMRTEGEKNFFDFSGNVDVEADSFKASCDNLAAESSSKDGGKPQVAYIKGSGHIRLSNENGVATADNMEILPSKSEVALSDNASLLDNERGMRLYAQAIVFLKERSTGLAFSIPPIKIRTSLLKCAREYQPMKN